jgi:iron complex transport system ATP-binding protein
VTMRLSVCDVSWRIGTRTILDHVRFDVTAGELVVLAGRNGAGKSSLVDLIAGLRPATAGEVRLDERPLSSWGAQERARAIAHLPQAVGTDLPFTAEQLVLMGRYPHGDGWFESDADRSAAETAMRRTGCLELRARRTSTLSGGERQRVLLAAVLAQAPRLLLLDEPSTFLDVDHQLQCFELLQEETRAGAACIAVTHDLNLALSFATRLIILAGGTVAADLSIVEATASTDWLRLFSPRLALTTTGTGRPWVAYT